MSYYPGESRSMYEWVESYTQPLKEQVEKLTAEVERLTGERDALDKLADDWYRRCLEAERERDGGTLLLWVASRGGGYVRALARGEPGVAGTWHGGEGCGA